MLLGWVQLIAVVDTCQAPINEQTFHNRDKVRVADNPGVVSAVAYKLLLN